MPEDRLTLAVIGIGIVLVVAGGIVGFAALAGSVATPHVSVEDTDPVSFESEELSLARLEADGQVEVDPPRENVDPEPGVVLIDRAHNNAVDDEDLQELIRGLLQYGHEVRMAQSRLTFEDDLEEADALVVIEPRLPYDDDRVEAVEGFIEDGGRVLLIGQPNRLRLEGFFLVEQQSEINSLGNPLGITFGKDYLYDMRANDGNHRNVVTSPTASGIVEDVDTAVLYTATHVTTSDGQALLVTEPSAQRSSGGTSGIYPVATVSDGVMAIGDATFLSGERHNVADNEKVIEAIVDFLSGRTG